MPPCPCCGCELEEDGLLTAGLWCWRCCTVWLLDTDGRLHGPYAALMEAELP